VKQQQQQNKNTMKAQTENTKTLYQINGKGIKVPKIGGEGSEAEKTTYILKIVRKAVKMDQKQGAKYLRTLGVSKNSPIYFNSFNVDKFRNLGKIKISDFVAKYDENTLIAIIDEITAL
jgi:hypothetical protein